jgi:hypothetical protein
MLNPFFLNGSKSEQGLLQDLINESIKIYGVEVYYLPRQYLTTNKVIEEVVQSEFNFAYPIEAYVDSYDGYGGQGTILSKFGIQELDDLNLIISKERWETYIQALIENLPDVKLSSRPKEGDLIYFPLGNKIFEIKYVEHEKPFYQLQKNYVYELRCELFRYEDELINTGVDFIDDPSGGGSDGDGTGDTVTDRDQYSVTQTLQLVGLGSTASAITTIVNGGVRSITVTDRGSSYTSTPTVAISTSPTGTRATGIATMIGGIVDLCEPDSKLLRVQSIDITNPGSGYTTPPKVVIRGGGGSGATAVATIGDGVLGIITVTNGGSGYLRPPEVSFVGVSSFAASANAIINNSGQVIRIVIENAGLGYIEPPVIQISPPDVIVGMGTYKFNEKVVGSVSGISARVKSWDVVTKILKVSNATGEFSAGETIVGETSGANYNIRTINTSGTIDRFAQNDDIQDLGDEILDFDEINPFGNP